MLTIRPGGREDLDAVAAIQAASPGAAQWPVADYLGHQFWVAAGPDRIHGFLVARNVAEGEWELLNLAVEPALRRSGVGRGLLERVLSNPGSVFLEVRESNSGARKFYESMGFREVGRRPAYYEYPRETAVVMKFHSC